MLLVTSSVYNRKISCCYEKWSVFGKESAKKARIKFYMHIQMKHQWQMCRWRCICGYKENVFIARIWIHMFQFKREHRSFCGSWNVAPRASSTTSCIVGDGVFFSYTLYTLTHIDRTAFFANLHRLRAADYRRTNGMCGL